MENLVYWFTFESRLKARTPPYFYIGSKTNAKFENGVIIDKRNKEYWSSSEQSDFLSALKIEKPTVKILHMCEDVLDEEERYHIHYDIPKSTLFFNKARASGKFGGSGERAPRFGMKNSEYTCSQISKAQKNVPKSKEHKLSISDGLNRFYEKDNRINNIRGKQVLKTWSDGAKKRYSNPDNEHPRGMLGKKMPRKNCSVCGKSISVNYYERHTNKCKNC